MAEYKPVPRNRKGQNTPLPQSNPASNMLSDSEGLQLLNNNIHAIYMALNQKHIEQLQNMPILRFDSPLSAKELEQRITIYKINKILYNENENSHEKLVSVFSALHSYVSSVTMVIQSDGKEINLYLCTSANELEGTAGDLLESNIKGQFPGSKLSKIKGDEKDNFFKSFEISDKKIIRSVSVIPGKRTVEMEQQRDFTSQGFEKYIDSLAGKKYTLLVVSQSVTSAVIEDYKSGLENLATLISPYKEESVSYAYNESTTAGYNFSNNFSSAVNESISRSFGTTHTEGISSGTSYNSGSSFNFAGWGNNSSSGTTSGRNSSDSVSENKAMVSGTVLSEGSSTGLNVGDTKGYTQTYNINRENKAITELLGMIDEHLERIKTSRIYGMWNCSCYLICDNIETASITSSTLQSLLTSDDTVSAEIYCNHWAKEKESNDKRRTLLQYIKHFQHPRFSCKHIAVPNTDDKNGREQIISPGLMVSGNELPIIMGLPRKSVPGVTVTEMAEFGRNIPSEWKAKVKRPINFGKIQHMGSDDVGDAILNVDTFSAHCFITGASGSGKSEATYNILKGLSDSGVKFLVIEPTKGEYKNVFGNYKEIFGNNPSKRVNIFTTNPRQCRMLRINPFEFHPRIHIQEHISRLVGTISACWPLEGAMPAFLKMAFESAYIKCGWDLNLSVQIIKDGKEFPDFYDLEEVMTEIIKETNYSDEVKGNYQGALLTRIGAMTNGFEGQIFCSNRGVSDKTLFDENCIVDLSNIGSQETRALIMGLLIIRLKEYRYAMAREANVNTKHITVLEEAHNILKRCSHEQSSSSANIMGSSVEMLTACIAEMRTYGEGFLIIDQSPNAVDITAIKNTAIKIVLRLPEEQDCKEIGNALTLTEEQVRELSRLDTGVAAVFHAGWNETILAKGEEFTRDKAGNPRYTKKVIKTVDHTELIKMRGFVVNTLYDAFKEKRLKPVYKSDIIELMQGKCTIEYKTLTDGKIDELIEIVSCFFTSNDLLNLNSEQLRPLLFAFMVSFLQIRDMFDIINFNQTDSTTNDSYYNWLSRLTKAMGQYFILPPNKNELPNTPNEKIKQFREICGGIINAYALLVQKNKPKFLEAWLHLEKQGCFK
jgi:hypothetical protein